MWKKERKKKERKRKKKQRKEITQSNFAQMFANKMSFGFHIEILRCVSLSWHRSKLRCFPMFCYRICTMKVGWEKTNVLLLGLQYRTHKYLETSGKLIFAASTRIFVTTQQNRTLLTVRIMREKVPWKEGQSTVLFA